MSASPLRAEDLSVRLGKQQILSDVSLDVAEGEVLGVLGPSGAGKSTLFRLLVGELSPERGRVFIGDRDVTREPLWRRARAGLGYVPQTASVLLDLSVERNIRSFEQIVGAERRPAEERAREVGLEDRVGVRARDLSGGERRRLELLRALIAEPSVLVCDEPLAGVDPALAARIGEVLRRQADRGAAVIVADHRVHEVIEFCDRALLLLDGRVEVTCDPGEFLEHPAVRRRYLG
jgi:lipopolysaccharide export system ATP-binding protein